MTNRTPREALLSALPRSQDAAVDAIMRDLGDAGYAIVPKDLPVVIVGRCMTATINEPFDDEPDHQTTFSPGEVIGLHRKIIAELAAAYGEYAPTNKED